VINTKQQNINFCEQLTVKQEPKNSTDSFKHTSQQ